MNSSLLEELVLIFVNLILVIACLKSQLPPGVWVMEALKMAGFPDVTERGTSLEQPEYS